MPTAVTHWPVMVTQVSRQTVSAHGLLLVLALDLSKCVGLPLPSFMRHNIRKQCLLFGQVLLNLIQLLTEVLAGDLHQIYFLEGTLHRKARRHPTLLLFFDCLHGKCIWSWQCKGHGPTSYLHNRGSVSCCHESPDGTSSVFVLGASLASQSPPCFLNDVGWCGTSQVNGNFIFATEVGNGLWSKIWQNVINPDIMLSSDTIFQQDELLWINVKLLSTES